MMVTAPVKVFLMLSTAATVALVVAGTGASTLWFLSVLRTAPIMVQPSRSVILDGSCNANSLPTGRAYSAFRAPCPSVTSRRGHSLCRWPVSRRVTATAPAKSHAYDPVAGARKGPVFTIGGSCANSVIGVTQGEGLRVCGGGRSRRVRTSAA